ncbi:MAG: RluA family pseudouridine synthase [Phycisphaerales bacterium]
MQKSHLQPRVLLASRSFVVVNKPAGLLSVPGIGPDNAVSLLDFVRDSFPNASGPLMVHRLDMETSGAIIVALNPDSQRELSASFELRRVTKHYIALLEGCVELDQGRISLPLRLDVDRRPFQIVDFLNGREAVTDFQVLERGATSTRVRFTPLTGRTHQLRVHAATPREFSRLSANRDPCVIPGGLGAPIRGDQLYSMLPKTDRLMLHAHIIEFDDPDSGSRLRVEAPCPF